MAATTSNPAPEPLDNPHDNGKPPQKDGIRKKRRRRRRKKITEDVVGNIKAVVPAKVVDPAKAVVPVKNVVPPQPDDLPKKPVVVPSVSIGFQQFANLQKEASSQLKQPLPPPLIDSKPLVDDQQDVMASPVPESAPDIEPEAAVVPKPIPSPIPQAEAIPQPEPPAQVEYQQPEPFPPELPAEVDHSMPLVAAEVVPAQRESTPEPGQQAEPSVLDESAPVEPEPMQVQPQPAFDPEPVEPEPQPVEPEPFVVQSEPLPPTFEPVDAPAFEPEDVNAEASVKEEPVTLTQEVDPEPVHFDESISENTASQELLAEKKPPVLVFAERVAKFIANIVKDVPGFVGNVWQNILPFLKRVFANLSMVLRFKYIIILMVIVGLGWGGYTIYTNEYHVGVYKYFAGFFEQQPVDKTPQVPLTPQELRGFGFNAAAIFAENKGSVMNRVPEYIEVALLYGELREARVSGETGISAATFYGELKDEAEDIDQYVEYVSNLARVQAIYGIDVYEMLNRTAHRDKDLLTYLSDLKRVKEESQAIFEEIGIVRDDLTVAFASLTPDKTQYEQDFFVSLEELKGEKSDLLLKSFIDASQKQVALKARINALNRLLVYYKNALQRLDLRILAVESNMDALIQGIRVVEITGGGVDVIIRPETSK